MKNEIIRHPQNCKNDLTGKKFGRLTVIGMVNEKTKDYKRMWQCECECGKPPINVRERSLLIGDTRSCGCLHKEALHKAGEKKVVHNQDLTGRRFGRLTVLKKASTGERGYRDKWECRCDCGKTKAIARQGLEKGRVLSCGCLKNEKASMRAVETFGLENNTNATRIMSKKMFKNNTTGARGVYLNKKTGKYRAGIGFKGKWYSLGTFGTFDEAKAAREAGEEKLHGPFLEWYKEAYPERFDKITKGRCEKV